MRPHEPSTRDEEPRGGSDLGRVGPERVPGWSHPAGSNLVAWARQLRNTAIVTILLGDGPTAYRNEGS